MQDVHFPNAGLFFFSLFIIIMDVLLSCPSEDPLLLSHLLQLSEPCPHHYCSPRSPRGCSPKKPGEEEAALEAWLQLED